jgi:hypothetical protein
VDGLPLKFGVPFRVVVAGSKVYTGGRLEAGLQAFVPLMVIELPLR